MAKRTTVFHKPYWKRTPNILLITTAPLRPTTVHPLAITIIIATVVAAEKVTEEVPSMATNHTTLMAEVVIAVEHAETVNLKD